MFLVQELDASPESALEEATQELQRVEGLDYVALMRNADPALLPSKRIVAWVRTKIPLRGALRAKVVLAHARGFCRTPSQPAPRLVTAASARCSEAALRSVSAFSLSLTMEQGNAVAIKVVSV
jgi:hypothetical protein